MVLEVSVVTYHNITMGVTPGIGTQGNKFCSPYILDSSLSLTSHIQSINKSYRSNVKCIHHLTTLNSLYFFHHSLSIISNLDYCSRLLDILHASAFVLIIYLLEWSFKNMGEVTALVIQKAPMFPISLIVKSQLFTMH